MKGLKILALVSLLGIGSSTFVSCTKDLADINKNDNFPEVVPTYTIFNGATRHLMETTRDGWWSARMTLPWMQYSAQNNYVEEDQYQYRDSQTEGGWRDLFRSANNYKDIIELCTSDDTKGEMETYGNLENQIAVSRIMLAYTFDNLVSHFGDIPYWSYGGKDNPDFQALQIDDHIAVKYVSQEEVYKDILKELKEASDQLVIGEDVFAKGDNIYKGNAAKWKKFANSLRLRIANRIKEVYPAAQAEITDAISKGVFTSNDDNAIHAFGTSNNDANPFWKTFYVGNRTDFFVNRTFIQLLKGETGNFGFDPRLYTVAAPTGLTFSAYNQGTYEDSDNMDDYPGMPYGLPKVETYFQATDNINIFAKQYLRADRGEVLMEYSEVEFILSEINGWSQEHYEKGVKANMERLEIDAGDINDFIANLPIASKEDVLVQKYVTLFYNSDESWNEYRRTGYPKGDILLLPGQSAQRPNDGSTYTFEPLQSGNVLAKDLPDRVRYPVTQQSLNRENWKIAADKLGGDEIDKKLWFVK